MKRISLVIILLLILLIPIMGMEKSEFLKLNKEEQTIFTRGVIDGNRTLITSFIKECKSNFPMACSYLNSGKYLGTLDMMLEAIEKAYKSGDRRSPDLLIVNFILIYNFDYLHRMEEILGS